jgi:F-type H+-transporting ATPase subunit delta
VKYFDPVVANRYAHALFHVAQRQGVCDLILEQVAAVGPALRQNETLTLYIESPQISTEQKVALLDKMLKPRLTPLLYNLLVLLLRKGRIDHTRVIMERFRVLVERDRGIEEAEVRTASPMDDAQKAALQAALERRTGFKLLIRFRVDPAVIGGVRFKCGDLLIDDTVQGKLYRLRQRMEAAVNA